MPISGNRPPLQDFYENAALDIARSTDSTLGTSLLDITEVALQSPMKLDYTISVLSATGTYLEQVRQTRNTWAQQGPPSMSSLQEPQTKPYRSSAKEK